MKEIIVSENNKLEIRETEIPEYGENEVLVKVAYSGLCGSDIPRIFHHGAHYYPVRLGHEFTGHVISTGSGVTSVKEGDKVCCVPLIPNFDAEESKRGYYSLGSGYSFIGSRQSGGNAEYITMPESSCFLLPEDITEVEGAFFEPVTVGIHPILMSGGCKDKNVIVVGVGTIGMLAMQSAKALGARTVTAVDISDERLALAEKLGADYIINSMHEDAFKRAEFLDLIRFDQLILETAGVPQAFKLSLELAGPRAQIALVGTLHKDLNLSYKEYELILRKELTVFGSWMNYSKPFPGDEWNITIDLFRNKKMSIEPLIDCITDAEGYVERVLALNGGPANGKILLCWN
ncbi:zinc-binding dehydrogenase [Klebsiella variicola]|uniref:zinc-binding dehydrogenase n=1 Tax=Klebsiella variicola TaxID=244366 RepID=UPI0017EF34E0|nr:zinc-binding dehydrogenase [Klebsiella variicola]EAV1661746.1 galactitol-1-phosphate 5-dehydrogenase [Salmonella enterica]EFE1488250.1 zinc-binding dehydrogenase [Escherichia coli]HDK8413717.1 zinc-binding dehydrogenase [Klebsiella pneumoniae]EEL9623355.1 alcohol dehydrogenase catalytic domain-containing protein [Salmonella enterica]ELW6259105.1 zinc-binding dehydrogenase [Escherichia coli]